MDSDAAQLASVSTALDELTARVVDAADRYQKARRDDVATDLYEVERALKAASRRLSKTLRELQTRPT
ncbi:MAG: hypothetical protein ACRD29_01645 [Acidimicrobiales bacterium]